MNINKAKVYVAAYATDASRDAEVHIAYAKKNRAIKKRPEPFLNDSPFTYLKAAESPWHSHPGQPVCSLRYGENLQFADVAVSRTVERVLFKYNPLIGPVSE